MLTPLRCKGCGDRLGYCYGRKYYVVYCSELCATKRPPVLGTENRDGLIRTLVAMGVAGVAVAKTVGLTRQRVAQISKGE